MKPKVIAVAGPTASGKTALSIELAKKLGGEIVSADSRLVYKGFDIASAKPTIEERDGVPHYLIDIVEPEYDYSAGDYVRDAKLDYNQGIDFYKLGMYERAIESFRAAVRTYPDYTDAYYNMAIVLEYLKQYAEALNVYKQVYIRNPHDYEVIYKLALMSSKLEDYNKAAEYVKLIPTSSEYYVQGQEIVKVIDDTLNLPPQKPVNPQSSIAQFSGIYENILSPTGVTSDNKGNLYIAQFSDNAILKITPEGKRQIFLKSELINGPISLAADTEGNIYVSNYNSNNVVKITPQGIASVFIAKADKPYGLHVEGNMLFVTCQGSHSVLRQRL